jgi:hypothetical protein
MYRFTIPLYVATLLMVSCTKDSPEVAPTVAALEIVSVGTSGASLTSEVTSEGSSTLLSRGICWDTVPNPTIESRMKTSDTLALGVVASQISGLTFNKTYYVRGYAANAAGVTYSEEKSFTTQAISLPTISKLRLNGEVGVVHVSATIESIGNGTILEKGICVSLENQNPTINDQHEIDSSAGNTIRREVHASNPFVIMYIRAYVTNEAGTTYSNTESYTAVMPIPDPNCSGEECLIALKPNIYLYPTVVTDLSVFLSFPQTGQVTVSIPEYSKGWHVRVDPNGKIDNAYTYLYYESAQPDVWQKKQGWSVAKTDLEAFFIANLKEYSFSQTEINDFTEYWLPILTEYPYFQIFPQNNDIIDPVIKLSIFRSPDNIQRLFYYIEGVEQKTDLPVPLIDKTFSRQGFYVTEWGVVFPKDFKRP